MATDTTPGATDDWPARRAAMQERRRRRRAAPPSESWDDPAVLIHGRDYDRLLADSARLELLEAVLAAISDAIREQGDPLGRISVLVGAALTSAGEGA